MKIDVGGMSSSVFAKWLLGALVVVFLSGILMGTAVTYLVMHNTRKALINEK